VITLLTLKAALKKAWVWMKHNWKVPFIIIYTLVLWLLFRKKDAAYQVLEERNNSYKSQIDVINKSHKEELEKRNQIIEKYNDLISEIEDKYSEDRRELDNTKRKEVKELVEKYHDDPDALAKLMAEKYGLDYVE